MKTVNSYLVKGEYNTLIDCGEKTEAALAALITGLKDIGLLISDIDKIVITHAHVDHMGMARHVQELSGAQVHVSSLVHNWAVNLHTEWDKRNVVMLNTFSRQLSLQQLEYFLPIFNSMFGKMSTYWETLDESMIEIYNHVGQLDISGHQFESIHCPGHTYTQACFLNEYNGDFFSADMLLKITPTCVIESDNIDKTKRNKSMVELLDSFAKLRELGIKKIYPGHFDLMDNHVALIDRQVNRITMRKNQVQDLISSGCGRFFDLFQNLYEGKMNFPGLVMILGYLDLLESEGRVQAELTEDGILYSAS